MNCEATNPPSVRFLMSQCDPDHLQVAIEYDKHVACSWGTINLSLIDAEDSDTATGKRERLMPEAINWLMTFGLELELMS